MESEPDKKSSEEKDITSTQFALAFFGVIGIAVLFSYCTYGACFLNMPTINYPAGPPGLFGVIGSIVAVLSIGGLLGFLYSKVKANKANKDSKDKAESAVLWIDGLLGFLYNKVEHSKDSMVKDESKDSDGKAESVGGNAKAGNGNEKHTKEIQFALAIFGVIVIAVLFVYCLNYTHFFDNLSGSYLVSLSGLFGATACIGFASLCVGGFLGLLFGVPKSILEGNRAFEANNSNGSSQKNQRQRLYRGNTNLEDMSDWLTKIIVGASFVEIHKIATGFILIVKKIAVSFPGAPFIEIIVATNILGFGVLGFFVAYLMTRLFFIRAFNRADGD